MLTDVQHINGGLSKIAASRIQRIDPPATPLEKFMASNYETWKRAELTRRRWVFALVRNYKLTLNATIDGVDKPYKFVLPIDCLRPIRGKRTEWVQAGRYIYSCRDSLCIDYISNAPESSFDPLFTEVLECKIAFESAEFVTQSATKKQTAMQEYDEAVLDAARANAFIIGPEDIEANDDAFSWLNGRYGMTNGGESW